MTAVQEGSAEGRQAGEGGRPLRADAQRNLGLILAAARTVFARRGLDATLDEVAKEAGLGVGTVYRRFRDKGELAEALFAEDLELLVGDAEEASAYDDPWEGFVAFLVRFTERQALDCGLQDLVSSTAFGDERFVTLKERLRPAVQRLVERAQRAGAMRADADTHDVVMLGVMLGAAADFARCVRPDAWRRYLRLLLDGLRAGNEQTPLDVAPLDEDEVHQAMACWRPRHR